MRAGALVKGVLASGVGVALVIGAVEPVAASDSSTAKKLVITKADVGRGFTAEPPSETTDAFALIAECVGKPVGTRQVVAQADGPELVNDAQHSDISSSVEIVKTKAMAKADRAVVTSPSFPDCFAKTSESQAAASTGGVTSISAQRANVKQYGDYSTAVLAQVKGTDNGKPVTLSVIDVLIQKGRAEVSGVFITDGVTPFDRDKAERILDKLAKRLDKAKV